MQFPEFDPIPEFNPEIPDFNPEAGHELIDSLDQLIQYAMIPEERKELLYKQIFTMSFEDAVNLYLELKDKQVNRIHAGINYNMTYIKDFMRKSI